MGLLSRYTEMIATREMLESNREWQKRVLVVGDMLGRERAEQKLAEILEALPVLHAQIEEARRALWKRALISVGVILAAGLIAFSLI